MPLIELLKDIDTKILLQINGCHFEWLDFIMYQSSERFIWIPFYLLIIYFLIKQYKKDSLLIFLFIIVTIVITDQLSVHLFKNVFERYRPCHTIQLEGLLHLVNNKCGGQYGFISSHAANAFAILFFLTPFVRIQFPIIWYVLIVWALLLSYSSIYLGVHYPSDVVVGIMVGGCIGMGSFKLFAKFQKKLAS